MQIFFKYILYNFFWVIAFSRLLVHEILWKCRLKIAKLFLKKKLLGHVLSELNERGVCVIPGYYSASVMGVIITECRTELDTLSPEFGRLDGELEGEITIDNGVSIERYPGSIKIKNPNNPLLNMFRQDRFLMMVAAVFCQKLGSPVAIYHLSHDGSLEHPAVPGSAEMMIAEEAHLDSPFHGLKVFTALEEINDENAPFVCLEQSASDLYILKKRVNYLMQHRDWYHFEKSPHYVEENHLNKLLEKHRAFKGTIQPGDLVLFDTCNVHYPSKMVSGLRSIFWLYF